MHLCIMAKQSQTLALKNIKEWRTWLSKNHESNDTIWLVLSKKDAPKQTISRGDALDEALCYGWIDGTTHPGDAHTYVQSFSRRKPKSMWSKINKDKVALLIKEGRMAQPGLDAIKAAKANGYWTILDDIDNLTIPPHLQVALAKNPKAAKMFETLSPSDKKRLLAWIKFAQRPETRQKRIDEMIADCAAGIKPKYLG
jgi:uncharacterized protein YdeI (YjbR/CyaY-like superfamily)